MSIVTRFDIVVISKLLAHRAIGDVIDSGVSCCESMADAPYDLYAAANVAIEVEYKAAKRANVLACKMVLVYAGDHTVVCFYDPIVEEYGTVQEPIANFRVIVL